MPYTKSTPGLILSVCTASSTNIKTNTANGLSPPSSHPLPHGNTTTLSCFLFLSFPSVAAAQFGALFIYTHNQRTDRAPTPLDFFSCRRRATPPPASAKVRVFANLSYCYIAKWWRGATMVVMPRRKWVGWAKIIPGETNGGLDSTPSRRRQRTAASMRRPPPPTVDPLSAKTFHSHMSHISAVVAVPYLRLRHERKKILGGSCGEEGSKDGAREVFAPPEPARERTHQLNRRTSALRCAERRQRPTIATIDTAHSFSPPLPSLDTITRRAFAGAENP